MEITKWKWYELGKLFPEIYKGVAYNAINLEECPQNHPQSIRYITRTDLSNGCKSFVINDKFTDVEDGNAITIGDTTSTIFYQSEQFICGDHIVIMRSPILNEIRGIFIVSLLHKERFRYCYGRAFRKDIIKKTKIKLPSNNNGDPDWLWIENYVKTVIIPKLPQRTQSVWTSEFDRTPLSNKKNTLNVDNWRWFQYEQLFKICGSSTTPKDELDSYGSGSFPYITTQAVNNGVENFYNYYTEIGNVLTVDSAVLGFCAYQQDNFSASDHVEKLVPKFPMNKYIALFLTTLINKEQYRYSYGRKCSQKKLKKSLIKLPAILNADGEYEPDWQFMEDYIKSLPYSRCLE